jgi:hypothetical protein
MSLAEWFRLRLNMELDLQSLFGLLCTAVHVAVPTPPAFGLIYEGAIGRPRYRRHYFITPWVPLSSISVRQCYRYHIARCPIASVTELSAGTWLRTAYAVPSLWIFLYDFDCRRRFKNGTKVVFTVLFLGLQSGRGNCDSKS